MATAKVMWLVFDFIGLPIYFMGILANIDNGKSIVLSILGAAYLMFRIYYYHIQKAQAVRQKEIELWHLEQDKQDRINGVEKKKSA